MTQIRASLESIAPTVDEAIEKGLEQLNLNREDVEVQVLDEGKKTIFRFAARQARVKLIVKSRLDNLAEEVMNQSQTAPNETASTNYIVDSLQHILELMEVDAEIEYKIEEEDDDDNYRRPLTKLNLEGDDLRFLIGRKSEVLNAFQYLLSLIASHRENQWVPVQLDIQNSRGRREMQIKKIATRIADQVAETGKRQSLEPMPANERRLVHMILRKRPDVYTESFGEEPHRKIYIYPKK